MQAVVELTVRTWEIEDRSDEAEGLSRDLISGVGKCGELPSTVRLRR